MTELPPFADFAKQLNTLFAAQTAHGSIGLQLVEAKELLEHSGSTSMPTPASLIFSNTTQPDIILSQGIYQFEHSILGNLSLYIEPVLSGQSAPNYQVLIN